MTRISNVEMRLACDAEVLFNPAAFTCGAEPVPVTSAPPKPVAQLCV